MQFDTIFYCDGSLRDIFVDGTTWDDYRKLFEFLRTGEYELTYWFEQQESEIPESIDPIRERLQQQPETPRQRLSIDVDGVQVVWHFFDEEEIELTLLPNEVDTDGRAEAVFAFIAEMGRALNREVMLTPENVHDEAILIYDPATDTIRYQA